MSQRIVMNSPVRKPKSDNSLNTAAGSTTIVRNMINSCFQVHLYLFN